MPDDSDVSCLPVGLDLGAGVNGNLLKMTKVGPECLRSDRLRRKRMCHETRHGVAIMQDSSLRSSTPSELEILAGLICRNQNVA